MFFIHFDMELKLIKSNLELPKQFKLYPNWIMKIQQILKTQFRGTTLYPFGIYLDSFEHKDIKYLANHELIHWKQQKEMFIIFFYLWYLIEWIVNIFIYGKKAYIKISFEQEGYFNGKNLNYLKSREKYAWLRYIKFKPIN